MCSSSEAHNGRFRSRMMRVRYCTGLRSSENSDRRDRWSGRTRMRKLRDIKSEFSCNEMNGEEIESEAEVWLPRMIQQVITARLG